jgi:hypothetical protein
MHKNLTHGDGAATEWHAIEDLCPKHLKLPNLPCEEGAAIEQHITETHRPKLWKSPDLYVVLHE